MIKGEEIAMKTTTQSLALSKIINIDESNRVDEISSFSSVCGFWT
jgi:hypothetical protein